MVSMRYLVIVCLFSSIGKCFAWSFTAWKGLSVFCPTPASTSLLRPLASVSPHVLASKHVCLRLRMQENDGGKPGFSKNMPTAPPFDPSALMPPFGPGKSRYAQLYKSSGDAADADAEAVGEEGEAISNSFYVGYEEDELAALWAVHETNFGAYDGQDDDQQTTNLSPVGGLHELVLEAIGESEPNDIRQSDPKELVKLIQAHELGALGLDELILQVSEQADAEQASGSQDDDQQTTNSSPVRGLHEFVLEAIGESEPKEDVKLPSRASRMSIILGLDELIQESREQVDAEQAFGPQGVHELCLHELGVHELVLEACEQADAKQKETATDDSELKETK